MFINLNDYEKSEKELSQLGKSEGARFDEGKTRFDLIPPNSLDEIALVYTYGANKYDANNWWRGMKWTKVIGPIMRHLMKWLRGEKRDPESNCHHLALVALNCIALIEYERNKIGQDDRVPFNLDMMNEIERESRIKKWKILASENKLDEFNGNDLMTKDELEKLADKIFEEDAPILSRMVKENKNR